MPRHSLSYSFNLLIHFYFMASFLRSNVSISVCCLFLLMTAAAQGQVQTARAGERVTSNVGGFYEYLPQGYDSGSEKYPLLLFLHGAGELGNGNGDLPLVLRNGPPKLINQNQFPTSFTVNGQQFKFIVISPQFEFFPGPLDIVPIMAYMINKYRVDINRIYLTGLSMGGGVTWEYAGLSSATANKLAAIVPICGASYPDETTPRNIANANLPVWATHNNPDPTVDYNYSVLYVQKINAAPSPNHLAKLTTSPGGSSGHDAWTATYNPNSTLFNGGNIYSWMLQYSRSNTALPVLLKDYSVALTGTGKVAVNWTTSFEQNNDHFTIERSADGINFASIGQIKAGNQSAGQAYSFEDGAPITGNNFYRLSQTDIDGKTSFFDIKKISIGNLQDKSVKLFPNPASEKITVEMQNDLKGKISITILNASGKSMKRIEMSKQANYLQQAILLNDVIPGYYVLEIKADHYSWSSSFIKK